MRRRHGQKAVVATALARESVRAQREGRVTDANAAYDELCRLVSKGNAAYWMLTAEYELTERP